MLCKATVNAGFGNVVGAEHVTISCTCVLTSEDGGNALYN